MTDPEQTYLTQHAAALVCVVADRGEVGLMDAFRGLSPRQLRDLAVWLARHVSPAVPFFIIPIVAAAHRTRSPGA